MLTEPEIRAIASNIVQRAKATARVDQGTLRRSIAYTYVRGVVTFRQIYYGVYGDNSQLEQLAKRLMPNGVEYRIELTNERGGKYTVTRTKQGRRKVSGITKKELKDLSTPKEGSVKQSTAIRSVRANTTQRIRDMIAIAIAKRKAKENGEEEN